MCTVILLRRPDHSWPLLLAANRDEMTGRPWRPPARHWPDRPDVVAGLDVLAGGTWLGLNDEGVVAAVLNRYGTLGPLLGKRSRGELPLEALDHADAAAAAEALADLRGETWRAFNMIVADARDAFWLRHVGSARIEVVALPPGLTMITAADRNDPVDPRIRTFLPRFEAAPAPAPEVDDWAAWETLLASPAGDGPAEAGLAFSRPDGFATLCSSLIALPAADLVGAGPILRFAAGRPGTTPFHAVDRGALAEGDIVRMG